MGCRLPMQIVENCNFKWTVFVAEISKSCYYFVIFCQVNSEKVGKSKTNTVDGILRCCHGLNLHFFHRFSLRSDIFEVHFLFIFSHIQFSFEFSKFRSRPATLSIWSNFVIAIKTKSFGENTFAPIITFQSHWIQWKWNLLQSLI